jgi:hypothetical protein
MSKLKFLSDNTYPEIREPLKLDGYDPKLKGSHVEIWLNWSRDFNDKMVDHNRRVFEVMGMQATTRDEFAKKDGAMNELLPATFELNAKFWGCTPEEAQSIYDLDVELWNWISDKANAMRQKFKDRRKN